MGAPSHKVRILLALVSSLQSARSSFEKERLLLGFRYPKLLANILRYMYSPTLPTLKIAVPHKSTSDTRIKGGDVRLAQFRYLLRGLLDAKKSGEEVESTLAQLVEGASSTEHDLYCSLITRSLNMGITRHTVNKVFPGLIPIPPAFMFPEEYNDLMPLCYPVYLEPKIQGIRIKLFSSASGDVAAWNPKYTNYGHLFKRELEVMAEEAIKSNTDIEVDGELCEWKNVVYTGFMVKSPPKEGKAFVFKAFDSVRSAEKDKPLVERRRDLVKTVVKLRKDGVRDPQSVPLYFHLVPAAEASSKEDVLRFHTKVHAKTNEGVILKDPHSRYERGRSTAWLCMRQVRTEEAEILEVVYDADKRVGCLLCRTYAGEEILVNVEERLRDTLLIAKASLVGSACKLTVKEGIECSTYSLLKLLHEKTL